MMYQTENFLNIIKYAIHKTSSEKLPELQEPVDWGVLVKMAKEHNLFALFHEVAYQFPEYKNSEDYEKNVQVAILIVAQQVQKTEMFLELYRAFLKEDLHPIVMKGIICRQLYGDYAEHRPSGDEDILVEKKDFYKVKELMEESGYKCELEQITKAQIDKLQHISFVEKTNGFLVEIHTNMMGHRNALRSKMSNCFEGVFSNFREENIKSVPIRTLSHTEHFLFLVLHAFRHFTENGVGIRQLLDILLYQERYENQIDWSSLTKTLQENDADKYLGDIQHIGCCCLGFDLKQRLATVEPQVLLEDMMEVGVFGKRERTDIMAGNIVMEVLNHEKKGLYAWLRAGFPARRQMLDWAPYLEDRPWLLPIEWIKRWARFIKRARKYDGNLMRESLYKSQKRIELLRKYGL